MISLVQSAVNIGPAIPISAESLTFSTQVTQGNLLVLVGFYTDFSTGPVTLSVSVTDSQGNIYSIGSQPFRNNLNQVWWMQYSLASATAGLTQNISYSNGVPHASISCLEYASSFGWISAPSLDGTRSADTGLSTPSTPINTGPITTTNPDDLIFAMVQYSVVGLGLSPGWSLGVAMNLGVSTAWIEQPSLGSIGFTATQGGGVSSIWSATIWAFTSNQPSGPSLTFNLITSSINLTHFPESYQNRIPEDIYDSLEQQPGFVYVRYGPSPLNV